MFRSNPDNIPGLTIWVDASDISTVNNGQVTNGQNVFKIVDKASGIVFRNGYGNFGPTYSIGVVNEKNAISFNYYLSSTIDSLQAKGLWASDVTTMATGTYSLYCVSFPYDNRQRNTDGAGILATQQLHLISLINNLPTISLNYSPHRRLTFQSIGNATPNQSMIYREDTDFIFPGGSDSGSALFDKVNQFAADNNTILPSNNRYIYGKTNIIGVRTNDGSKKLTVIRRDYLSNENFQSRSSSLLSINPTKQFVPAVGGPWLTIGAMFPNDSSRSVEGVSGPMTNLSLSAIQNENNYPFEGYFCEFLFYNRQLTLGESNSVEKYLKKKWIG